jgi:hypothetical protein
MVRPSSSSFFCPPERFPASSLLDVPELQEIDDVERLLAHVALARP